MQPETLHSASTRRAATEFPPLELVNRPTVPTPQAAYYLNRAPQTLRDWKCNGKGPLRPISLNGRLAWKVADIKRVLDLEVA